MTPNNFQSLQKYAIQGNKQMPAVRKIVRGTLLIKERCFGATYSRAEKKTNVCKHLDIKIK